MNKFYFFSYLITILFLCLLEYNVFGVKFTKFCYKYVPLIRGYFITIVLYIILISFILLIVIGIYDMTIIDSILENMFQIKNYNEHCSYNPDDGVNVTNNGNTITTTDKNNTNNKFVNDFIPSVIESNNEILSKYPFTILYALDMILTGEIILTVLLINIFFVNNILLKIDYKKYIPNNKIGEYLTWFLERYIKIYSKTSHFLIGYCLVVILFSMFFSKFFFYIILYSI
jgi:hypothetical protein